MKSSNQIPWTFATYIYYLIHYYSPVNRQRREKCRNNRRPEDNMKLLIILLLVTIIASSCITRKACERRFPTLIHDSTQIVTNTITVYRDTTLYIHIPGDTVFKSINIDEGVSLIKTPYTTSYAWVTDGILKHKLEQKDTAVLQNIKGALRTTTKDQQYNKTIERVKYVNKLTNWQIFQIYLGRLLTVLIILLLCLQLIKRVSF